MSKCLNHLYFTGLWFLVVTSTNKGLSFVLLACSAMLILSLPNLRRIEVGGAALILTVSLLSISVAGIILQSPQLDFNGFNELTILFYIFYLSTLIIAANVSVTELSKSSETLIYLFSFVFLLQFLIWCTTGNIFDANEFLFGQQSRQNPTFWNIPRFSTFFEEPSTFAAALLALAFVVQLRNPWSRPVFVAIALVAFSFSFVAFLSLLLIPTIWIFTAVSRRMSAVKISIIMGISFVAATIFYLSLDFSSVSFQNTPTNIAIRIGLLEYAFGRDGANVLLGSGFFGDDSTLKYFTDPRAEDGRIASVNDLGAFVYFFVEFGYLGVASLFVFILMVSSRLERTSMPFFWVILFSKISILHPLFFILLLNPRTLVRVNPRTLVRRVSSEKRFMERDD